MNEEKWQFYLNGMPQDSSDTCCPISNMELVKMLPAALPGMRALDVGCGDTRWSLELAKRGYMVTSTDINPKFNNIIKADMHELPFANESFDVVFASQVIEHSISPMIMVAEFSRVLKDKGLLAISTPVDEFWMRDPQHWSVLSPLQWEVLFNKFFLIKANAKMVSEDGSSNALQQMWIAIFRKACSLFPSEKKEEVKK